MIGLYVALAFISIVSLGLLWFCSVQLGINRRTSQELDRLEKLIDSAQVVSASALLASSMPLLDKLSPKFAELLNTPEETP